MSRNIKLDGQTINNVSQLKILDADTNEYISYSDKTLMALSSGSLQEITIEDIADLDTNKVSLKTLLSMTPELTHLEIPENVVWGYGDTYHNEDENYLYRNVPNLKYLKWNNKDIYRGSLQSLKNLTTFENVDQIEKIYEYAFYEDAKLNVPLNQMTSLTEYQKYAFANTATTATKFPATMKEVPSYAYLCTKITDLSIPEGYTKVGSNAFNDCDELRTVTLPKSVIEIESYAFAYCDKLNTITFRCSSVDKFAADAFNGLPSLTTVYVPDGSEDAFIAKFPQFEDKIVTIALDTVTYTYYVNGEALQNTTTTNKVITTLPEVTPPEGKVIMGWYTDPQFNNKVYLPFYSNEDVYLYVKFGVLNGRSRDSAYIVKASEIYNGNNYSFAIHLDENNEKLYDNNYGNVMPFVFIKVINDLEGSFGFYFQDSSNDGRQKYIRCGYIDGTNYMYQQHSTYGSETIWNWSVGSGQEYMCWFKSDTEGDKYQIDGMTMQVSGYYYGG